MKTTDRKGRIIDLWFEGGQIFLELIEGEERIVLQSHESEDIFRSLRRGDWITACVTDSMKVLEIQKQGGCSHGDWNPLSDGMRWRRLTGRPSRMSLLRQRQKIVNSIRESLSELDFLEVETPLLVKGTCPDAHIESYSVQGFSPSAYLVTSTEYQIKRLMVGGFERVYTLTKNFRAGDRGRYHSSEFTMLEWARSHASMDEIEEDAIYFIRKAFQKIHPGKSSMTYHQCEINFMNEPWERLSVKEALSKYLGLENLIDFSYETLCKASLAAGIHLPPEFLPEIKTSSPSVSESLRENAKHFILSFLLDRLQSHLGLRTPTFLREWPAYMTSSAKMSAHDSHIAERSELYIGGIEIADGFPFLRDPELQKTFFSREMKRRSQENKATVEIDERYLEALEEGIPPGAGMALGVDRLVMVLTQSSQLSEVQAFSWDEI